MYAAFKNTGAYKEPVLYYLFVNVILREMLTKFRFKILCAVCYWSVCF